MKTMKKILALVLTMTLCLGLGATCFAVGSCSVTIEDAIAGQTYNAYRIFDAEKSGDDKVVYTIDTTRSQWINTVAGYNAETGKGTPVTDTLGDKYDTGYVVLTKIAGTTKYTVTLSERITEANEQEEAAKFAAYLSKNIGNKTPTSQGKTEKTPGAEDNKVTVSIMGLDPGYYFVDTTLGALTSLGTVTGAGDKTIHEKNSEPNVKKEVQEDSKATTENGGWGNENTADIGDTVSFRTTITIDKSAAENIVLHDKMSKGLTFNVPDTTDPTVEYLNFKVKIGNQSFSSDRLNEGNKDLDRWDIITENTGDDCTFEVRFNNAWIEQVIETFIVAENKPSIDIEVHYTATVNKDAVIGGDGNENTATLKYGDENTVSSTPSTTKTYVYGFNVFKFYKDGANNDVALEGAEFVLYKGDDTSRVYATVEKDATTGVLKLTGWTNQKDAAEAKLTSDDKGFIKIVGLDADTYYLEETKAPDGYNMLTAPVKVVISESIPANGETSAVAGGTVEIGENRAGAETVGEITNVVKVENKSGTKLPETGGIGTTIFYVVGAVLMLGAVILLITKKKMASKQ